MMVWLDAKRGSLAAQVGLPHLEQVYDAPVITPASVLQTAPDHTR